MVNDLHPQATGIFEVKRAVVDEDGTLRGTLRYLQRDPVNGLLRFASAQVAGSEKSLKLLAQAERLNAVLVQLTRLIVNGRYIILPAARHIRKHSPRIRILLGLREHERGELLPGEGAGAVEERAVEILIEGDLAGVKGREREIMAFPKFLPVQPKRLSRFHARVMVPAVGQDYTANVPKQRRYFWHEIASRPELLSTSIRSVAQPRRYAVLLRPSDED